MDHDVMRWAMQRPEDWDGGEQNDVFLWGGGRHGQIAGCGKGVKVPTLASTFGHAQQVVCGQNCTFVLLGNGTVQACGEGSYGRLGMGNSDDLLSLTVVSALQGRVTSKTCFPLSTVSVQRFQGDFQSLFPFFHGQSSTFQG